MVTDVPDSENSEEPEEKPSKLPDDVVEKALDRLRRQIKGNGLKIENLTLQKQEGAVLEFGARNTFKIEAQISEKNTTGREQGEICGSKGDIKTRIQNAVEMLSQNKDIKKHTVTQLKNRADKGFAVDHQSIRLDKHKQRYVIHQSCNICRGDGKIECKHCNGKGQEVCNRCHGDRFMVCNMCRSTGMMNTANGQQQCTQCRGEGRVPCRYCHQSGTQQCAQCKSTGQMGCHECNRSGWRSQVTLVQFKAVNKFDYEREKLPNEVVAVIDDLGPAIITEKHAKAEIVEDINRDKELDGESTENKYVVGYDVKIPWGEIITNMKTMPVRGNVFGYQGELLFVTPFMERLAGKAIGELTEMARSVRAPENMLKKVCRYRIIRETLFAAAGLSAAKGRAYMSEKYPFGFEKDESLPNALMAADRILKNITKAPRQKGLFVGLGATAVLFAGYFLGNIPALLSPYLPEGIGPSFALDAILLATGCALTLFLTKQTAKKALHDSIGRFMPESARKSLSPKTGRTGLNGALIAIGIFFALLESTAHIGVETSAWYELVRSKFLP